ncbi:hypothetical protein [Amycolatopsis silviterrae]|uniref:Uncharacterized protein n=1 Tax=Amycolatopsis silviterrae TaxID=1656914 RepID=A0ABW5GZK4_9PSEU
MVGKLVGPPDVGVGIPVGVTEGPPLETGGNDTPGGGLFPGRAEGTALDVAGAGTELFGTCTKPLRYASAQRMTVVT